MNCFSMFSGMDSSLFHFGNLLSLPFFISGVISSMNTKKQLPMHADHPKNIAKYEFKHVSMLCQIIYSFYLASYATPLAKVTIIVLLLKIFRGQGQRLVLF